MNYSNQLPPDFWTDLGIMVLLLLIILILVAYGYHFRRESQQLQAAAEIIDTTYNRTWSGHSELRLYAWMVTAHKLRGHENKHVAPILRMKIQSAQRTKKRDIIMRSPAWDRPVLNTYKMIITKPTP